MRLAKAYSISLFGLAGRAIEIEADISSNLPGFVLVGLPDASLNESAARVRAAATNSGLGLPARKITVNLSPASVPKHGSGFDLAIAVATLRAAGIVKSDQLASKVFLGELALDGTIKPIRGILPAVLSAQSIGFETAVVPAGNLVELSEVEGIQVVGYDHLTQVAFELGAECIPKPRAKMLVNENSTTAQISCYSEVLGQDEAVSAMKLAAAGGHHVLMVGPPGAGKTMLASRLPGILPELTQLQRLENLAIRSLVGLEVENRQQMPYQAPHSTATLASMIGGGASQPKPGLVSLAHNGVLFLDEAPEFQTNVLDSLRQPLESGVVTISRASGNATFPAKFQLILAANPCPCGFAVGTGKACSCSGAAKAKYLSRISGPLADRIDMRMELNQVNTKQLSQGDPGATSARLRAQVVEARAMASHRLSGTPWQINAEVPGSYLRRELRLEKSVTSRLDNALDRALVTMRGYDRTLRLAWTISDCSGRQTPNQEDIQLAMFYRGAA